MASFIFKIKYRQQETMLVQETCTVTEIMKAAVYKVLKLKCRYRNRSKCEVLYSQ